MVVGSRVTRIPLPLIVFGMLMCMVMVSPYEYSWTLFTTPLGKEFGLAASSYPIGTTFSIYIVVQALSMFLSGRFLDKRRNLTPYMLVIAGVLAGSGWLLSSLTTKALGLDYLYTVYGIGSIGVGIVYGVGVSTALKWFKGKTRGTLLGLIDLGFGAGSFALSPLVNNLITDYNYHFSFQVLGVMMLVIIIPFGAVVRYPPAGYVPVGKTSEEAERTRKRVKKTGFDMSVSQMVRTWQFYGIYIGFFFIAGAGLGIVGHLIPIGRNLGFTIGALIATYLFPLSNGIGRFVSGVVSDYLGRPLSMLLFFGIGGVDLLVIGSITNSDAYIATIMLYAFCWGPLFTLWPAIVGDFYGSKNSGGNYGFVYTSKAIAGLFAGYVFSVYFSTYGDKASLILTGVMSLVAALIGVSLLLIPKSIPKGAASTAAASQPHS